MTEPANPKKPTETPTVDATGLHVPEPPADQTEVLPTNQADIAGGGATADYSTVARISLLSPPVIHKGPADALAQTDATATPTGLFKPAGSPAPVDPTDFVLNQADQTSQPTGLFVPTQVPGPADRTDLSRKHTHPAAGAATGEYVEPKPAVHEPPAAATGPTAERTVPGEIGHYAPKKFHAKGGMGEIFVAEDTVIGRSVALKRMLRGARPEQVERFLVEARITGQLEHPGVVPVHELGVDDKGQPYYVMKFVHGQTLKGIIAAYHASSPTGDVPREVQQLRLLQVFVDLCQTVGYAHSRGVLHRDLKPENVMLGSYGETLVLDWGLAKIVGQPEGAAASAPDSPFGHLSYSGISTDTMAGSIMGSPAYMSPEAAEGMNKAMDPLSDIYLLGATLYEILTGQAPRGGVGALELIKKARTEPPTPPRKIKPDIPRPLEAICLKAIAHRKEDRYPTALALAEDMQRYLAGEPVTAYPEGPLERAWRCAKKHRRAIGRSAAVLLVIGVAAFGFFKWRQLEQQWAEERRQKDEEIRLSKERELKEAQQAQRLKDINQARKDMAEFHRLADEMRYYAANSNPVAERAPYFDPRKAEAVGQAALARAKGLGPELERLALTADQTDYKNELYDLVLMMAQTKGRQTNDPRAGQEMLALLDRAADLRDHSRGYYQLRADGYRLAGEADKANAEQKRANDPKTPTTALDHFLLGERFRTQASNQTGAAAARADWKPNRELLDKAIEQYRLALQRDPEHYWSHFQLGRCYLSLERAPEAIAALSTCVALRKTSPWGYSARGFALALLKRYDEAASDLDRALELDPDLRAARLNRGVVSWFQKNYNAALKDFAAVLEPPDDKKLVEAAYYRGMLHLEQDRNDDALKDLDLVVAEKPDSRPAYRLRALVRFKEGENAKGLKDLDAFITGGKTLDLRGHEGHEQRGRQLRLLASNMPAQARKSVLQLARAELQKAIDLGGNTAALFYEQGAVLELLGQIKEAIAAYSKGLEKEPRNVKLLVKRGWAYSALKLNDEAQVDFAVATRVDPNHAEAHCGLGFVQACRKSYADARREANQALLYGGGDYLILHNVACIYAELSRTDKEQSADFQDRAIDLLGRAIALWKQGGSGRPDEIEYIRNEQAFPPALRARPEFQELLKTKKN
jgi:lipoprotein NlpI